MKREREREITALLLLCTFFFSHTESQPTFAMKRTTVLVACLLYPFQVGVHSSISRLFCLLMIRTKTVETYLLIPSKKQFINFLKWKHRVRVDDFSQCRTLYLLYESFLITSPNIVKRHNQFVTLFRVNKQLLLISKNLLTKWDTYL